MSNPKYDLGYLEAAQDVYASYILSQEIYWSLGKSAPAGQPPYPQLTLGSVLLARKRLDALTLSGVDLSRYEQVKRKLELVEQKWRTAFENKARREIPSRVNLWRNYLDDYCQNPANHQNRYPYEVQRRVMLDLLSIAAGEVPKEIDELISSMDTLLKSKFVPGEFVWETELKRGFPVDRFWYLYGNPQEE